MIGVDQDVDAIAGARHQAEIDQLRDGDPPRRLGGALDIEDEAHLGDLVHRGAGLRDGDDAGHASLAPLHDAALRPGSRNIRGTIGTKSNRMTTGTASGRKEAMLSMTALP